MKGYPGGFYAVLKNLPTLDLIFKELRDKRTLEKDDNALVKFPNIKFLIVDIG